MNPRVDSERLPFSFFDLVFLFRDSKKTILYWILGIGMIAFLFALTQPIYYQAEASFREKSIKGADAGSSGSLLQLLSNGSFGTDQEALSVFTSYKLLSEVIQQLGLQADLGAVVDREGVFKLVKNNLKLAWAGLWRHRHLILTDPCSPLQISHLVYKGEVPLRFLIKVKEEGYEIFDCLQQDKSIGCGKWGERFEWGDLSFILQQGNAFSSETFYFNLSSIEETFKELLKHFEVEVSKKDKNLLKLKYKHRNRHLASTVLNKAMTHYQDFIQSYHDCLAVKQLDYLNARRTHLTQNLTAVMQQHAHFLSHDLYSAGFIETDKEMEFLAKSQLDYKQRLLDKNLEIKRLEQIDPLNFAHYDRYGNEGDPTVINTILEELRTLKQQKEALEIELKEKGTEPVSEISQKKKGEGLNDIEDHYRGITLENATGLYQEYSKQVIQIESTIRQNLFFIHQIEDPSFEISSLSAGVSDSISLEIIRKAGELELSLKDQNNQSPREQQRIKEELNQERLFLSLHLQQMVRLMQLNKALFDEKILTLQHVSLELLQQRLSLLEKNLQNYIQSRLSNLHQERDLIKAHLEEIQTQMIGLPKKWVAEKLIEQEVETNQLIVEEIAKLVESKNISHNLEVIQSAPLDLAIPPVQPEMPKAFFWGILGCFLGFFIGFAIALVNVFKKGLPLSVSHLEERGYHVSGTLISPCGVCHLLLQNHDLETLRRLQGYFDLHPENFKLLLLLEGEGPHYASHLALLFLKRGKRVLTLDLNFMNIRPESSTGLLQYLLGEISYPTIQHTSNGDRIPAGGYHPFANEMVTSPLFQRLIEQLKLNYDLILVVSRVSPCSVEATTLLPLFNRVVITLSKETTQTLSFYDRIFIDHPDYKWTFVLAEQKEQAVSKERLFHVLRRYYRDIQQSTGFANVFKVFKSSKLSS